MRYLWLSLPLLLSAQDTLRVMAYNLLNYGGTPGYCNTSCKDFHLRTLIGYIQPDIIGINEIAPASALFRRFLDSVLNINGVTYWRSSIYQNVSNGNLVNALFYDSRRLGWLGQELITTQGGLRDIYAYHLYYLEPNLAQTQDTLFLVCIVSHLKAGNTSADAQQRGQAATQIKQYIQNLPPARRRFVIEMGDHNLYGSTETAYQELMNVLVDPGPAGAWSNNSAFALFHTQSTRTSSLADGGSGGGLDDRFDFILFSPECTTATARAQYVPGSFWVVGQDGQRFKQAITATPLPAGYPTAVINALYAVSDHLPVVARFALSVAVATGTSSFFPHAQIIHCQVREGGQLILQARQPVAYSLVDAGGRQWHRGYLSPDTPAQFALPAGLYMIVLHEPQAPPQKVVILP